jgi:hypothetical protein
VEEPPTLLREPVDPLDVDGVGIITAGTILWAVAFLVLLPFSPRLVDTGHGWWLGMCATGALLGCYGIRYSRRRRDRVRSGAQS